MVESVKLGAEEAFEMGERTSVTRIESDLGESSGMFHRIASKSSEPLTAKM